MEERLSNGRGNGSPRVVDIKMLSEAVAEARAYSSVVSRYDRFFTEKDGQVYDGEPHRRRIYLHRIPADAMFVEVVNLVAQFVSAKGIDHTWHEFRILNEDIARFKKNTAQIAAQITVNPVALAEHEAILKFLEGERDELLSVFKKTVSFEDQVTRRAELEKACKEKEKVAEEEEDDMPPVD